MEPCKLVFYSSLRGAEGPGGSRFFDGLIRLGAGRCSCVMGSASGGFFGAARCGGGGLGCGRRRRRGDGGALGSCAGAAVRTGSRPGSGGGSGCGRSRRCSAAPPSGSSAPPGTCAGSPGKSVWREEAWTQLGGSGSVEGAQEVEGFPVGWGRSLRRRWSCSGTCWSILYEDGTLIRSL